MDPQFYYKKNRLQQIKGFCYSVQEGSMVNASRKLNVNASTISVQIKSLETDLGVKLLETEQKKIKLTKEGKIFYDLAIHHVFGIEDLFNHFREIEKRKKNKTISIGGNVSICYILPKFIKKFEEEYPEVEFEIRNLVKQDAMKRLINDEIDVLVYSITKKTLPPEIDFIPIVDYNSILLTNKDHPLTKKKNINLSDIKPYKLLRLDPQFITVPNFDAVAQCHGLETKIEFEMANYEILKKFVKAGVGIAVVSSICLEDESDKDIVGRDLSEHFPHLTYGIMTKKGKVPHPLLEKFINMLNTEKLLNKQKK